MSGRKYMCWLDGEQFAVLCYNGSCALQEVVYFDYLFDAEQYIATAKAVGAFDDFELIRIRLNNVTAD